VWTCETTYPLKSYSLDLFLCILDFGTKNRKQTPQNSYILCTFPNLITEDTFFLVFLQKCQPFRNGWGAAFTGPPKPCI
jgi:hypothetical protein